MGGGVNYSNIQYMEASFVNKCLRSTWSWKVKNSDGFKGPHWYNIIITLKVKSSFHQGQWSGSMLSQDLRFQVLTNRSKNNTTLALWNVFSNKSISNSGMKCVRFTCQGLHMHKIVGSRHNFVCISVYLCPAPLTPRGEIQANRQGGAVSSTIHIQPM